MIKFYRSHFLGVEFFLSLLIMAIIIFYFHCFSKNNPLITELKDIRGIFYGTIITISGALLGFVITSLSVLLTTGPSAQMERLKSSKHYKTIFTIFLSTSKFLGVSLLFSLISLVFDKEENPVLFLTYLTIWSMMIVTFRILRCFWVLEKIIYLQIKQ